MKLPRILRGAEMRDSCFRNKDTGELECTRKRINKDGTAVDIAGFKMSVDASCTAVMTEAYEHEEGHLNQLEKKFVTRTLAKCNKTGRNIPQEI